MIRIWKSLKMKKPWVEIPRAPIELLPDLGSKIFRLIQEKYVAKFSPFYVYSLKGLLSKPLKLLGM